jgi:hypothetical protein
MPKTKDYVIPDINKKQAAVVQSLKPGAKDPFSAKETSFAQASEAAKKGEWRLAVWCADMTVARKRAKDLNARACIAPRTLPQLPKKEEGKAAETVKQLADVKVEKPGEPKQKKFTVKSAQQVAAEEARHLVVYNGKTYNGQGCYGPDGAIRFTDDTGKKFLVDYPSSTILFPTEHTGEKVEIPNDWYGRPKAVRGAQRVAAGVLQSYKVPRGHDFYCSNCGRDMEVGETVFSYRPYVSKRDDGYPHYCSKEHAVEWREQGRDTEAEAMEAADPHAASYGGPTEFDAGKKVKADLQMQATLLPGERGVLETPNGYAPGKEVTMVFTERDRRRKPRRVGLNIEQISKDNRFFHAYHSDGHGIFERFDGDGVRRVADLGYVGFNWIDYIPTYSEFLKYIGVSGFKGNPPSVDSDDDDDEVEAAKKPTHAQAMQAIQALKGKSVLKPRRK